MARRNIINLSSTEWNNVVAAFNRIKSNGTYDAFTRRHMNAMMQLTRYPGETNTQRNVAHRGPAFLPWHRASLIEFERALGVELPYWNWEATGSNWRTSGVWSRIGGNGNSTQNYRVTSGPFANWTSVIWSNGSFVPRFGIIRRFNTGGTLSPVSVTQTRYDVWPWSENTDPNQSWRQLMERAHNNVHNLVGGDMQAGTSPNDPLFWLHHSNVDRIWWRWQARNGYTNYQPQTGGPPSHNVTDTMQHLTTPLPIGAVLDPRVLSISYDTLG